MCQCDVVGRLGVEIIRDELVVPIDTRIRQVKTHHAALVFCTFLDQIDRVPMAFEYRREFRLDLFTLDDLVEGALGQVADDRFNERRIFFALEHLHQLERRRTQLDALSRRIVQSPVDDVGPLDQFGKRTVLKTELLLRDAGYKLRARFAGRIEKFLARHVCFEVQLILGR